MAPTTVAAEHEFEIKHPDEEHYPHEAVPHNNNNNNNNINNINLAHNIINHNINHYLNNQHLQQQYAHNQLQLSSNNNISISLNINNHDDNNNHMTGSMSLSSDDEPTTHQHHHHQQQAQFLPICDIIYNLVSLIAYFCDSTFNIIAFLTLYQNSHTRIWAHLGFICICFSSLVCQSLSLKWALKAHLKQYQRSLEQRPEFEVDQYHHHSYHIHHGGRDSSPEEWIPEKKLSLRSSCYIAILHCLQCGLLLRYIRLVIPVADSSTVKKEARDLCILRICHAFCQSAPLLLFQTYIIWSRPSPALISNLSITSALLSMFSLCWALASFTKYAREKFLHRFVLSWFGVITQFLWRAGTVSSRVVALTIYATHYGFWVIIVLILHWCSMFLWLLLPNNLLRDEKDLKKSKKLMYAGITAWVYCFCYLNFEERNSKQKMFIYYLLMFLENNLLLSVCVGFSSYITWYRNLSILTIYLGFISGIVFMFIYYKHFHVNVLDAEFSGSDESIDSIAEHLSAAGKKIASQLDIESNFKSSVFSCRFNPAFAKQSRRKKKMPPTHIPG